MFDGLPLHPLAVHFPVVLSVLIPLLFVFFVMFSKSSQREVTRKFLILIAFLAALFFLTSLMSTELAEVDEGIVKRVVSHSAIHHHEEWGEKVPWLSGFLFLLSLLLVKRHTSVPLIRIFAVGSLVICIYVLYVGHTGAELAYKSGAASAFRVPPPPPPEPPK